ncbi:MAG: hypothetical protein GY929_19515 [Actinomycetia bacterium]|nr:hypothetical protein [Actinomycetes bacterium]
MSRLVLAASLVLLLLGCGGSALSMTEYAESLDLLVSDLGGELEAMDVQVAETPTIEEAQLVLGEALSARTEFQESLTELDPPSEVAGIHNDLVDLHARVITSQQAFAARAATATSLDEVLNSSESEAYQAVQIEMSELCPDLQARFDSTAVFADIPWIGGREVVRVVLGCSP